jgi:glucose-1-phosphate thymidylyltransferase
MRTAGARNVYVILRKGKWDIPSFLGAGSFFDLNLAYLIMRDPYGVPFTIDQAYPFVRGATIVFGFPDILFKSQNAFVRLLSRINETGADLVLGLFSTMHPQKMDMVERDDSGRVRAIVIKPDSTRLELTWVIAAWKPGFTNFLHEYVETARLKKSAEASGTEIFMGDVIQAAIEADIDVDTVVFPQEYCTDVGTPDSLYAAVQPTESSAAEA